MRLSSGLLTILLIAAVVSTAGCTQGPGPSPPATMVTASHGAVAGPDLASLALSPVDLPACFSLTGKRVKTPDNVSDLARNLGWEAGYEVIFSCLVTGAEPTVIVHSLALYPASNVPGIAAMVDLQDRPAGFLYENISDPDPVSGVSGFHARYNSTGAAAVSPGSFVLAGGKDASVSASGTSGDFAEFVIFRRNVFEVLKMSGPGTNVTLLSELARKSASRIP